MQAGRLNSCMDCREGLKLKGTRFDGRGRREAAVPARTFRQLLIFATIFRFPHDQHAASRPCEVRAGSMHFETVRRVGSAAFAKASSTMKKARTKVEIKLKATTPSAASVTLQAMINDPKYETDILTEDIHFKRVWSLMPADGEGWMKLVYSADGPTGDPWQIGRVRMHPGHPVFELGDLTDVTVVQAPPKE